VAAPDITCPNGQCFTDVPSTDPFYTYANSLYLDGIVTGYACGGTGEPCDAEQRPYYRPSNNVTRAQMSKFVDNGRRNIADAIGSSLYISNSAGIGNSLVVSNTASIGSSLYISNTTAIGASLNVSTTAGIAVGAETRSGGEGVYAECLQAGNNCYALEGYSPTGDYAAYIYGGKGVYAESADSTFAGVDAIGYGASSAGGQFYSPQYRSLQVDAPPSNTGYVQLGVNGVDPTLYAERIFNGGLYVEGNLTVVGSKSGYVVDAMQNVDSTPLEPGDVVTIMGSSAPVIGQIPVATVKKASTAYDTGVAGVVDQVLYVPDAATKARYEAEQNALRLAQARRDQETQSARGKGTKPDYSRIAIPQITITDQQGSVHAIEGATQVAVGGYANVVTLGSYKEVKVDASFGPIRAGDLLVASPHAGYAMKATDRSLTSGATIGKALGNLESGTGLIPVIVTLK
jgi:hypothetical protein